MPATINNQFLSNVSQPEVSWRWPTYQSWLNREDFCTVDAGNKPFWWNVLPSPVFEKFRSAAFIEWRYYSIISRSFHGICGFSLFNPENHFAQFSEGGLIAIIAGALDGAAEALAQKAPADAQQQAARIKELCYMHVFPMDTVIFYGPNREHVRASHEGIELKIEQVDFQTADVTFEMEGGLSVKIRHQAVKGCPVLAPVTGTDFRTIPGAHWTVFNPSPVSQVNGSIIIRPGLLNHCETPVGLNSPNFISQPLAEKLYDGYVKVPLENAAGYYEHSFGLNPMPLHGWDFVFVPCPEAQAGLVLQTYRGSQQVTYLEVVWAEADGQWKTLHIPYSDCQIEWAETNWHPQMRVHVPRKRIVRAQHQGYKVELINQVVGEIPFLRAHSPVVRHFFISEEISLSSWTVTDPQGRVCVSVQNALSGGETARGRWYYNLNGIFSLTSSKPF
ncbi:MAG: hypothetical protein RLZZ488_1723 [Pseudomonadota bacterium]|jgi:hypothetical protein